MRPIDPSGWSAASTRATESVKGVGPDSQTETFVALEA